MILNVTENSPYSSFDVVQTPSRICWRRSASAVNPRLLSLSLITSITTGNSSGPANFDLFLNGHIATLVRAPKSSPKEKQAQRSFNSIRPGRVRKSKYRRVEMARRVSLVAWLEVAAVRRICRCALRWTESFLRDPLQLRPKQYCRGNIALVPRLFFLQRPNAGHRRIRPYVSANALRPHRQHGRDHDRSILAR